MIAIDLHAMAEEAARCPRCWEQSCTDPDSKECSDNCIMRLNRTLKEQQVQHEATTAQLKSKEAVLMYLHTALGVKWGEDPYAAINALKLARDAAVAETLEEAAQTCAAIANFYVGTEQLSAKQCEDSIRALMPRTDLVCVPREELKWLRAFYAASSPSVRAQASAVLQRLAATETDKEGKDE